MHGQKTTKQKIASAAKGIFVFLILATVVYIMANGLGLVDSLDFGAGAYYYADIPNFASLVNGDHFQSQTSMGVLILLFLAWGFLMYKLWVWLERKFPEAED